MYRLGLKNLWMMSKKVSLLMFSIFLLNAIFLIALPMHSSRYEHLLTVPLLIIFLYAFKNAHFPLNKMKQIFVIMIALMTFLIYSYFSSYFKNTSKITTIDKINSYKALDKKIKDSNNFVIYSNEPRYAYWYYGLASCDIIPSKCLELSELSSTDLIYFIGTGSDLKKNSYLKGYSIVENQENLDEFNIWTVTKKESTIKL